MINSVAGIKVTARNLAFAYPEAAPLFEEFNLEVAPGERVVILCRSNMQKTVLAKVLAGLLAPSAGVVRYNDMITLGRGSITYDDVQWALQFVELDEEVDHMPDGLTTHVTGHGNQFTLSQILRLLLARAIVTRPHVLIVDGTLHSMAPSVREVILRRLCSKDEPWSIIFVSNDPTFSSYVDRRVTLE